MWLAGYLSNFIAKFAVSAPINLAYWWITATLVMWSFQISPERFLQYDRSVMNIFLVSVLVACGCYLPLAIWPGLSTIFVWRFLSVYWVLGGFGLLMRQLYAWDHSVAVAKMLQYQVVLLVSALGIAVASYSAVSIFIPVSLMVMFINSGVVASYVFLNKSAGRINLEGSLSLAMSVSWGYSLFVLILSSWHFQAVQGLFFCDCWKTMGIVMLADHMRFGIFSGSKNQDRSLAMEKVNVLINQILPVVFAFGYLSAAFWAIVFPHMGWVLPVRLFATVLVSACPCVITIAIPLIDFIDDRLQSMAELSRRDECSKSWFNNCLDSNLRIVKVYYWLSIFLSCGGSYLLWGVWITPWTAGLLMLGGQVGLLCNTLYQVSSSYRKAFGCPKQHVLPLVVYRWFCELIGRSSRELSTEKATEKDPLGSGEIPSMENGREPASIPGQTSKNNLENMQATDHRVCPCSGRVVSGAGT